MAVLGIALVGAGVLVLRPPPLPVETAPVSRGTLRVTIDEDGETRVRDRFVIAAPVAGRLHRITLDEGDSVEQGSVVARMNPLPLDPRALAEASARLDGAEAAKREADARVEQARAALAQAERAGRRARQLARDGTISTEERERADLEETTAARQLDAALFAARAADHNVHAARAALLAPGGTAVTPCADDNAVCVELRSPGRGNILRVLEESERVVAFGTPLIELGDPARLEVVIDVLSIDAVKVKPGSEVWIEEWGGEQVLRGRVRLVEPSAFTKVSALGVEEQRVNVIADFVEPVAGLGDGYRVEARIVIWEGEVSRIATSALFRHAGEWSVFVAEGGRARRRVIAIGRRNAAEVEVREGLEEGERVILHPSDLLEEGSRVADL
jgi:HlyD family secretion protein